MLLEFFVEEPSMEAALIHLVPKILEHQTVVDRDNDDCVALKKRLDVIADEAQLITKTHAKGKNFHVINRIAIEELEAWFFGDVEAIRTAYPSVDPRLANTARFRDPDAIKGGTWEKLEEVLKRYHPGGLEKIRAADEIARYMHPNRNRSKSFMTFRDALLSLFNNH